MSRLRSRDSNVSTLATRQEGLETAFVIVLADGTPVLRGTCFVSEVWKTAANKFRTPGILLGIKQLSPRSLEVFQRMQNVRGTMTLPSLSPPPPMPEASVVEAPVVEVPPPRTEVRAATTRQYFSPLPRTPAQRRFP